MDAFTDSMRQEMRHVGVRYEREEEGYHMSFISSPKINHLSLHLSTISLYFIINSFFSSYSVTSIQPGAVVSG